MIKTILLPTNIKYLILLLIGLTLANDIFGQNQLKKLPVLFSGIVFNSDSLTESLAQVNILKQNKTGTSSNHKGEFSIGVAANDTIVFSHIGFHSITIYIPDSIKNGKLIAELYLVSDTVKLDQLVVSSIKNYDEFKNSFLNMKIENNTDLANAQNNINLSIYEAQHSNPEWTTEDVLELVLQKEINKTIYKGQLPPDQMIDITKIVGGLIYLMTKEEEKNDFYQRFINSKNQSNLIYFKPSSN